MAVVTVSLHLSYFCILQNDKHLQAFLLSLWFCIAAGPAAQEAGSLSAGLQQSFSVATAEKGLTQAGWQRSSASIQQFNLS